MKIYFTILQMEKSGRRTTALQHSHFDKIGYQTCIRIDTSHNQPD